MNFPDRTKCRADTAGPGDCPTRCSTGSQRVMADMHQMVRSILFILWSQIVTLQLTQKWHILLVTGDPEYKSVVDYKIPLSPMNGSQSSVSAIKDGMVA